MRYIHDYSSYRRYAPVLVLVLEQPYCPEAQLNCARAKEVYRA